MAIVWHRKHLSTTYRLPTILIFPWRCIRLRRLSTVYKTVVSAITTRWRRPFSLRRMPKWHCFMIRSVKSMDAITFAYPDPDCHAMYSLFETNHAAMHAVDNPAIKHTYLLHVLWYWDICLHHRYAPPDRSLFPSSAAFILHPKCDPVMVDVARPPDGPRVAPRKLVTAAGWWAANQLPRMHWEVALAGLVWFHPGDVHFIRDHCAPLSFIPYPCNGENRPRGL